MNAPLRHSLRWLLAAQAVVILPQLPVLPFWSIPAWLLVALWFARIATGRARFPAWIIKIALAGIAVAGVYVEFTRLLNLEAMLTILVCAITLKLLELKAERDHWLLLMLCYFLVACGFLFSQQIVDMLIALVQLVVILMAQQALYRQRPNTLPMLRLTAVMALQSVPLMLVLFVVFPRIGPLWSMPLPGKDAITGMSDHLEFGDVARLSRSSELAFRVTFADEIPPSANLYWRGLVFESFDGRRWTSASWRRSLGWAPAQVGDGLDYTVTLEPGFHRWLYVLAPARIDREDIRQDSSFVWSPRRPLSGRLSYGATSDLDLPKPEAHPVALERNRGLPSGGNPRARALAAEWAGIADPRQRLQTAIDFFRQQNFTYTLNPPLMAEDNVDAFLFDARQGFCEHFAGSFTFLMRGAGVPARLVVGYQGGEVNTREGYLAVYQSDAHAWVEVWMAGEGWIKVDPTALVAPDRIQRGAAALMRSQGEYLPDSPLSLRQFDWARNFRYYLDSINYAWARWVLNYDSSTQWQVLSRLLGEVSPLRLVLLVLIIGGVPLLWLAISSLRLPGRISRDALSRDYLRCCRFLARQGVHRADGETPAAFARRVREQAPAWADWFDQVTAVYVDSAYSQAAGSRPLDGTKKSGQALRKLRRPFKTRAGSR